MPARTDGEIRRTLPLPTKAADLTIRVVLADDRASVRTVLRMLFADTQYKLRRLRRALSSRAAR